VSAPEPDRAATSSWERADQDWIRISTLVLAGLALLSAVLVPVHALVLHDDARLVMPAVAAASAVLLGLAALATRRRPALVATEWWLPLLATVPLANGLIHLGVTGQLEQTTTVMLTFVAVGALVTSRRALAAVLAGGVLAWAVVVATLDHVDDRVGDRVDGRVVWHYALQMAAAVVLAVGLHTIRTLRERRLQSSEASYRRLFAASPVGISLSDEHGRLVTANPALCALLGREEHELVGRSAPAFSSDDGDGADAADHQQAHARIAGSHDGVVSRDKRYVRPDGSVVWAWLTVRHTAGPDGQVWTLAHVVDVTERRAAEAELGGLESDLAAIATVARRIRTGDPARPTIVQAARDIIGAHAVHLCEPSGPDALIVTMSAGRELTGVRIPLDETSMTAQVFRTGEPVFLSDPASHPAVSARLHAMSSGESMAWQPVQAGGVVIAVIVSTWGVGRVGLSVRQRQVMALLADEAAVALEHERVLEELQRRAQTDALTGLPNRRTWDNELSSLLARARRLHSPLTVAVADLDRFKAFNDAYGHPAGDAHLLAFAAEARRALRDVDVMARWGGEEFAIALPECDVEAAAQALERVRAAVPGEQTCSIGYAEWDGVESAAALLMRADEALYRAKSSGRDRLMAADQRPHPLQG
jgi:diguanylate cyclase (GGDEF)-like protein/PAS domain S-box-containing protein